MLYRTCCYIEYENISSVSVSDINVVYGRFLSFFVYFTAQCTESIKLKVISQNVMSPPRGGTGVILPMLNHSARTRWVFNATPRSL
jgi:hypothetical protein